MRSTPKQDDAITTGEAGGSAQSCGYSYAKGDHAVKEIQKEYRVRGAWLNRHLPRLMGCTQGVGRYKRGDGMFRFVSADNNGDGTWRVVVLVTPGNHRAVIRDGHARRSFSMYPRRDIRKPIKMLTVEDKRAASLAEHAG